MMKIKQPFMGLVVIGALLLSACSHNPKNSATDGYGKEGDYADEEGAKVGKSSAGDKLSENDATPSTIAKLSESAANNKCVAAKLVGGVEQHVYFEYDRDSISSEGLKAVQLQGDYLLRHKNARIRIEGNTDDRGSREYNVALGSRRANSVVRELKQQGVSEKQIQTVSYGAEKPAALGDTETAYSCNRRVDIVFEAN